jgi:MSHA pilin protein MshD
VRRVQRTAGFTLIEVIVAMVIIAAAAVTILGLMSSIATSSATSMEMTQATSIANSYLRRVLASPFNTVAVTAIDEMGARDPYGNAIAGLQNYRVQVNVATLALGMAPDQVLAAQSCFVTVTVTGPTQTVTQLTAFKTDK